MDYERIIEEKAKPASPVSWWPNFAYHFTDITNALSIMKSGFLYSRNKAKELNLMSNDNASRKVIDWTDEDVTSSVRFYFRPLTPTQYYNEGYKHPSLRFEGDDNANIPIPVFFVFKLDKLLGMPNVKFSPTSQAGYSGSVFSGSEEFAKMPFEKIYDNSPNASETKTYRHAEILYPEKFEIDSCLVKILCRNDIEQMTVLNLLKEYDQVAYDKYCKIVSVCKSDMFYHNGVYINACNYYDGKLYVSFSRSPSKDRYTNRMIKKMGISSLSNVNIKIEVEWLKENTQVFWGIKETNMDYRTMESVSLKMPPSINADKILVQIYIDNIRMCYIYLPLCKSELL